nr:hypothetical protein [Candidatus Sigynarchaeota archaeon]
MLGLASVMNIVQPCRGANHRHLLYWFSPIYTLRRRGMITGKRSRPVILSPANDTIQPGAGCSNGYPLDTLMTDFSWWEPSPDRSRSMPILIASEHVNH